MKIAYFNYHHDIRGIAQGCAVQIRALGEALEKLGHQVDLYFLGAYQAGEVLTPGRLKNNPRLRRLGHFPRLVLRNLPFVRREIALLRRSRPDVLLTVSSYGNFSAALAARWLGIPLVLFSEAPLEYEYSLVLTQYYRYPRLGRGLEGLNIRAAKEVVCISEILKGYLMRYGEPAPKFTVIPNGVDEELFRPRPADASLQAGLDLEGRLVIGFVGSFWFFAGPAHFLGLAHALCRDFPEVVFLFVGGGDTAAGLDRAGREAGLANHFRFTGVVDHALTPRYLSLMDIAICPYRGDYLFYGSSMKLLEYMAAGKALVATGLGQIKEVVQDGYNGLLYGPDDWRGMEAKLRLLIRHPERRRELGEHARRTIEAGWTWEHQARRLAAVLARAAGT